MARITLNPDGGAEPHRGALRLKRSGMFWTVRGANAILALRCARLSGRFEDYWENRAQAA